MLSISLTDHFIVRISRYFGLYHCHTTWSRLFRRKAPVKITMTFRRKLCTYISSLFGALIFLFNLNMMVQKSAKPFESLFALAVEALLGLIPYTLSRIPAEQKIYSRLVFSTMEFNNFFFCLPIQINCFVRPSVPYQFSFPFHFHNSFGESQLWLIIGTDWLMD